MTYSKLGTWDMAARIATARLALPDTIISLGCARERGNGFGLGGAGDDPSAGLDPSGEDAATEVAVEVVEPAIEPGNPDIVYSQWQYGNLARYDRKTGEIIDIQPQPAAGGEQLAVSFTDRRGACA